MTLTLAVLSKAEGTGALLKTNLCKRGRSHVVQAAVRTVVIIIHPPAIRNISQLIDVQEELSIEQFISESAVERLDIAVFPGTARSDVQGLHTRFLQPFLHGLRHKFRAIITADVSRAASDGEEVTQQFNDIVASEASGHIQGQAFTREFVNHNQQPDPSAVLQTFAEEIIAPNVVVMLRPFLVTAIGTRAIIEPLMLFLGHFEPFLAPETVHTLEIDQPAVFSQKDRYSAIAIPRMLQ